MTKDRILIVDDEESIRFGLQDFLETRGYEVTTAEGCRGALESFRSSRPDVVITDYMLEDGNALELMPRLREADAGVPLILLTGQGSIDLAVQAMKEGAEHFLTKPVELSALAVILERTLENQRNRRKQRVGAARQKLGAVDPFTGTSPAIKMLAEQAKKVLFTDSPTLILGETGTGKGVLATWLHSNSPRADEAFVDLNCAGLTRELLETELFGHEKGAFTGASASKQGLFEVAHRGTIFLDEIGDVDPIIQPKLLKVVEEKKFRKLGSVRDLQVDIRLIAATSLDLNLLIREKKFRSDLYYRISTIPLRMPSLREREEDIPIIAQQLLEGFGTALGRGNITLTPEAASVLKKYPWPGNIRELRNVLERAALLMSDKKVLGPKDIYLESADGNEVPAYDTNLTLVELERKHIQRVLLEEGGQIERAAQRLGIPRSSLYQKVKKYQIAPPR